MSDTLIATTAARLFECHSGPCGQEWPADLWIAIEETGFPLALLSESEGGFGIDPGDALGLVRLAGAHHLSAPLAESMIANLLLARAGLGLAEGPAVFATGPVLEQAGATVILSGRTERLRWGRAARTVAVIDDHGRIARVTAGWSVMEGRDLAGDPFDTLDFSGKPPADAVAPAPVDLDTARALGALLYALQMAGALESLLQRTLAYAGERKQFGRAIGSFQAIQHALAGLASNVAAARAGVDMAAAGFDLLVSGPLRFCCLAAAAKLRAGEVAGLACSTAHQIHGAIGFTQELGLHALTARLWAWRDMFGGEAEWAAFLGAHALAAGPNGFWPMLTTIPRQS